MGRLCRLCFVIIYSSEICVQGFTINGCGNRSAGKELSLDLMDRIVRLYNDTKLGHGRVGKNINFVADSVEGMKGGNDFNTASSTNIEWSTSGVNVGAKAKSTVRAASEIGLTRIKRYVARLLDEFVDSRVRSTITAPSDMCPTIENVLNGKINVVALTETSNLDAIRETGQGAVRPAASTVLGNVLIETPCEVANAAHVTPMKIFRQVFGRNVFMRKRRVKVTFDRVAWQINKLIRHGRRNLHRGGDRL
jgi:hypothetical protein